MNNQWKNLILIINIFLIAYLTVGTPKMFTVMSSILAERLKISLVTFNNFLYNSGKYSLLSRITFAFLLNTERFSRLIPIKFLYFTSVIIHAITMMFCICPELKIHVIGRYAQGTIAGLLLLLCEPLIFSFTKDEKTAKKLLQYKYEIIALMAPLSILLTSLTGNWQLITIIAAVVAILVSFSLLVIKPEGRFQFTKEKNLLNQFLTSFFVPSIVINNICVGIILGMFLICFQYDFIYKLPIKNKLLLGLYQGIPFTLAFFISKLPGRQFWKSTAMAIIYILCAIGLYLNGLSLFGIGSRLSVFPMVFPILTALVYIIYVLYTPDILSIIISKNKHIAPKAILTSAQVTRTISTLMFTNFFNSLHHKPLSSFYYGGLSILLLVVLILITSERIQKSNFIGYFTMTLMWLAVITLGIVEKIFL